MKLRPSHYLLILIKLLSLCGAALSDNGIKGQFACFGYDFCLDYHRKTGEWPDYWTRNVFWPTYEYNEYVYWFGISNSSTTVIFNWDYLPPGYKALEIFLFSLSCIITLITICGNMTVIIVIVFSKLFRNNLYKIYLSVAVADLLLGVTSGLQALIDTGNLMTGKRHFYYNRYGWAALCSVAMAISMLSSIMSLALLGVERLLMFWSILSSKEYYVSNQMDISSHGNRGQTDSQVIKMHSDDVDNKLSEEDNDSRNDIQVIEIHSDDDDDNQINDEDNDTQNDNQATEMPVNEVDNLLIEKGNDNQNDIQAIEIHCDEIDNQLSEKDNDNQNSTQVLEIHSNNAVGDNGKRIVTQPKLENDVNEISTESTPQKKKNHWKPWHIRMRVPTDKNAHTFVAVLIIWIFNIIFGIVSNIDTHDQKGLFRGIFEPISKLTFFRMVRSNRYRVYYILFLTLCLIAAIIIVTATISSLIVFRILQSKLRKTSLRIHHLKREERVIAVTRRFVIMVVLLVVSWVPIGVCEFAGFHTDRNRSYPVVFFLVYWLFMAGSSWNWIVYTYGAQQFQEEKKKLLVRWGLISDNKDKKKEKRKGKERKGNTTVPDNERLRKFRID